MYCKACPAPLIFTFLSIVCLNALFQFLFVPISILLMLYFLQSLVLSFVSFCVKLKSCCGFLSNFLFYFDSLLSLM